MKSVPVFHFIVSGSSIGGLNFVQLFGSASILCSRKLLKLVYCIVGNYFTKMCGSQDNDLKKQ